MIIMNSFLFLLLIINLTLGSHDFLQEIPVKLLDIRSVASRYPASNSSHRIKVENGHVCNHIEHIFLDIFIVNFFRMKKPKGALMMNWTIFLNWNLFWSLVVVPIMNFQWTLKKQILSFNQLENLDLENYMKYVFISFKNCRFFSMLF